MAMEFGAENATRLMWRSQPELLINEESLVDVITKLRGQVQALEKNELLSGTALPPWLLKALTDVANNVDAVVECQALHEQVSALQKEVLELRHELLSEIKRRDAVVQARNAKHESTVQSQLDKLNESLRACVTRNDLISAEQRIAQQMKLDRQRVMEDVESRSNKIVDDLLASRADQEDINSANAETLQHLTRKQIRLEDQVVELMRKFTDGQQNINDMRGILSDAVAKVDANSATIDEFQLKVRSFEETQETVRQMTEDMKKANEANEAMRAALEEKLIEKIGESAAMYEVLHTGCNKDIKNQVSLDDLMLDAQDSIVEKVKIKIQTKIMNNKNIGEQFDKSTLDRRELYLETLANMIEASMKRRTLLSEEDGDAAAGEDLQGWGGEDKAMAKSISLPALRSRDVQMEEVEALHPLQLKLEDAEEIIAGLTESSNPAAVIQALQTIIAYDGSDASLEVVQRTKEHAIYKLSQLYIQYGREKELATLLQSLRPFFLTIPKAKTGKIIRTVIDMVSKVKVLDTDKALQLQADLCLDSIEWCKLEKHMFLRQRVEARLAVIYFQQQKYQPALDLVTTLVREIKKLDDKQLLVEIHLVESKLHHALRNIPKAKAALTAARSISNAIYVVPKTQSQIDQMSGILHAEEHDYKTGYSYFFEAFETLANLEDKEALSCLKYMLLCKIANGGASEVNSIINGKQAIKYIGIDTEALQAVAKAHEKRSLELFEAATQKYSAQLVDDPLIKSHLGKLYEQLLESNLIKIIQPFSCVEIAHVAKLINLPLQQIELKLSQMILDHKFHGILDQGKGQLIVYDSPQEDNTYKSGLGVIENVGYIVDSLFRRAEKLHA
ncbi:hypothetical protein ATCC90586_000482 [Pythium insidiosum]|nr:hypothetical protein ATCC90586_000482 [Pythium insidiosum]